MFFLAFLEQPDFHLEWNNCLKQVNLINGCSGFSLFDPQKCIWMREWHLNRSQISQLKGWLGNDGNSIPLCFHSLGLTALLMKVGDVPLPCDLQRDDRLEQLQSLSDLICSITGKARCQASSGQTVLFQLIHGLSCTRSTCVTRPHVVKAECLSLCGRS